MKPLASRRCRVTLLSFAERGAGIGQAGAGSAASGGKAFDVAAFWRADHPYRAFERICRRDNARGRARGG